MTGSTIQEGIDNHPTADSVTVIECATVKTPMIANRRLQLFDANVNAARNIRWSYPDATWCSPWRRNPTNPDTVGAASAGASIRETPGADGVAEAGAAAGTPAPADEAGAPGDGSGARSLAIAASVTSTS